MPFLTDGGSGFADDWVPIGSRSGYYGTEAETPLALSAAAPAISSAPAAPTASSSPTSPVSPTIADSYAYEGPRSDLPGGRGVRTRIGRQDDGKYGIRVWSSSGVLSFDQTYA